jgi:hypothetical protein
VAAKGVVIRKHLCTFFIAVLFRKKLVLTEMFIYICWVDTSGGGASNKYLIYNKARYVFKAFFIQIPDSIQLFKKDT